MGRKGSRQATREQAGMIIPGSPGRHGLAGQAWQARQGMAQGPLAWNGPGMAPGLRGGGPTWAEGRRTHLG